MGIPHSIAQFFAGGSAADDDRYARPNLRHPYRILHPGQNHSPHRRNPSSSLTSSHNSPNTLSCFAFICKASLKFVWRKFLQFVFYFRKPEKTEEPILPIQNPAPRIIHNPSLLRSVLLSSPENDSLTNSEEDYREIPFFVPSPEDTPFLHNNTFTNSEEDYREIPFFVSSPADSLTNSGEHYREIPCENAVFVPSLEDSLTNSEEDYREIPCENAVFVPSSEDSLTNSEEDYREMPCENAVFVPSPEEIYSLSLISACEEETVKPSVCVLEIRPVAKKPPESEGKGKEREKDVMSTKRTPALEYGVWIKHYSNRHRILLVGDGDFSFSAALAAAFGCASNMIATSLNSIEFLKENYKKASSNIEKLQKRKCKVMHGIDATKMTDHELLGNLTFDRVIFNFPFAGFFTDLSRASELRRHRRLVSLFLKNAKEMIGENGEIHITHKTNGFHMEWNLESVASSHGLRLIEAVKFNHLDYPGYHTKYGFGGDNNFNCNPSKTYKFGLKRMCY